MADGPTEERKALTRRAALARLGLGAAAAYVAPSVLRLSDARASHGSPGAWRGAGRGRGSGPWRGSGSYPSAVSYPSPGSFPSGGSFPGGHGQHRRRIGWRQHPRDWYWVGRHVPHDRFAVIRDYRRYQLPPPGPGHFYARADRDVFLIAEGTRRIIDAFLLFEAVGR